MDASDVIRKLQTQAIYTYYRVNTLSKQPTCNYSTCSTVTGCIVNYPTYEERQQVKEGQKSCNSCANTGCGCPS